jgi:hypothetical protein
MLLLVVRAVRCTAVLLRLILHVAVAIRTGDGFSFRFLRSELSREEIGFGCSIEGEQSLPKVELLLLIFSSLLDPESYPDDHRMHFYFLDIGHDDPDRLLATLEDMPTAMRLPHLLVEIGEILLLRTRYGSGEALKPDDRTHLISVFGSINAVDDDWFASDFCLLRTALGGTAKTETHLTCVDLKKFVEEHGPLLHGPSDRKPRKIVFNQNSEVFYKQYGKKHLADKFLKAIRRVSSNALPGERIVLVIVAHGHKDKGDVFIGSDPQGRPFRVSRAQVESCLACAPEGVQITILVTSRFSGFWALPYERPKMDPTVFSATTATAPSMSLAQSNTSGFVRGGFFPDAVVNELSALVEPRPETSPENQEPLQVRQPGKKLQRAISIGDLGKSTQLVNGPFGQFEAFCQRIANRFSNHKVAKVPQFRVGTSDQTLPVSAILGGNEELSTILRVEGILTLRPEDPFTCIGLGVENTYKAGCGDDEHPGSSSATYGNAAEYMAKKAVLIEGHPDDNSIIRKLRLLRAGKLTVEQQQKLWKLLVWRSDRDAWAESNVRKFNLNFPSISVWDGETTEPTDGWGFAGVFSDSNNHDCPPPDLGSAPYNRPLCYITAAAADAGLSVDQLRAFIKDSGKPTVGPRNAPPIPPRTSSISRTPTYNLANWSSLSLISSLDTSMGSMTIDSQA